MEAVIIFCSKSNFQNSMIILFIRIGGTMKDYNSINEKLDLPKTCNSGSAIHAS